MEEQRPDLNHLIEFLEFAKKHGYVNPGTANNRKRVVNEIFNTVKNVDTTDVTKLNIDDIFERYQILVANKVSVATLRGYKPHLSSAIREFKSYLTDPSNYRPSARKKKKEIPSKTPAPKAATVEKHPQQDQLPAEVKPSSAGIAEHETRQLLPSLHIDIQVHISPQSSDTQIDKVFESMAKHLKDLYKSTKATE